MLVLGAVVLYPTIRMGVFAIKHWSQEVIRTGAGREAIVNTVIICFASVLTSGIVGTGLAIFVGVQLAQGFGLGQQVGAGVGGIAAIVGHNYSVFLRFRGGKGLVCSAVLAFYFAPWLVGFWVLTFVLTVAATRFMVVGQMAAMAAMPVFAYFLFPQAAIPSYFATALVLVRHAPRIKNVLNGTEPKMYYKIRAPE